MIDREKSSCYAKALFVYLSFDNCFRVTVIFR